MMLIYLTGLLILALAAYALGRRDGYHRGHRAGIDLVMGAARELLAERSAE